jgi:hypothetical protein
MTCLRPVYKRERDERLKRLLISSRELNRLQRDLKAKWFVCSQCKRLCIDESSLTLDVIHRYEPDESRGTYCMECTGYCASCEVRYAEPHRRHHKYCAGRACFCIACRKKGAPPDIWYIPGYDEPAEAGDPLHMEVESYTGWRVSSSPLNECHHSWGCDMSTFSDQETTTTSYRKITAYFPLIK